MDYKKSKAPTNTVTRNIMDLCQETGNIYESVVIISKRANQISAEIKQDLSKKLAEFASYNDSLEEVFENREQIEISRYYEKLPKPTLIATQEYTEDKVYHRNPAREKDIFDDSAYSNRLSADCRCIEFGCRVSAVGRYSVGEDVLCFWCFGDEHARASSRIGLSDMGLDGIVSHHLFACARHDISL